jgi:outer membrane protein TolC
MKNWKKNQLLEQRISAVFLQYICCFSIVILTGPTIGKAQPLSELIQTAITNNLELKALDLEYRAALEKAPQVSQLPDPEVGVGAFLFPVETRLGAQQARVSAAQMFPWFGTLEAREAVALTNANALLENVAGTELELSYQVKTAYFKLYEIQASQSIIRQNVRVLEALRRQTLASVESGQGTAADVLKVDLKIREWQQELLILDKEAEKPLAELNQVLNRPHNTPVQVQDTFGLAPMPFNQDTLLDRIRKNHPIIRKYALQQEASRRAIALNELEGKPSFGLGIDYIMVNPRSDIDPMRNGRDIVQLNAKVSIPLWRDKYRAKEREENLKIEALENRKSDLAGRFLSLVEKAFSDYETARLRQELYAQQMTTTQAAIRILQAGYSASGNNFDELLRLETDLLDYQLKTLKAIVQSRIAQAAVERYINF